MIVEVVDVAASISPMESYQGGCHCRAVRFRVDVDDFVARACNCSICSMKGFVHVIVDRDRFHLESGGDSTVTYTFGTHTAKHLFCATCGVQSYYVPRSHPDGVSVNLHCLDGDAAADFQVEPFDGRNWENHVGSIR